MSYRSTVLATAGLVSDWELDETSGTTAADAAGTNPGTYQGSPTLGVPGISGTATTLNGTTQYVTVPDAASLHLSGALSLEAWVKTTSTAAGAIIVAKFAPTSFAGWGLRLAAGKASLWVGDGTNGWFTGNTSVADGKWHHVVGTLSGTTVSLYVDGVLDTSGTRTASLTNTTSLQIGTDPTGPGGASFAGTLDAVAVYAAALSATTVAQHYAAGLVLLTVGGARRLGRWAQSLGVAFCAVTDGGILPYDAATGQGAPIQMPATLPTATSGSPWGRAAYVSNGSTVDQVSAGRGFATMPPNGLTLFGCFQPSNVSASDQRIIKTCNNLGVGFGPRSGALQVINEGVAWYGLQGLTNGTWYAVAITINPSWGINSWLMNMQTRAITWTSFSAPGTTYAAGDGSATLSGQAQAAIPLAGFASRVWTEAEARTFLADPFALVPREPRSARAALLTATAAAGSGRFRRVVMDGGIPSHLYTGGFN